MKENIILSQKLIVDAIRLIFKNAKVLSRVLLIPFIILVITGYYALLTENNDNVNGFIFFGLSIISLIVQAIYAIDIHRILLLGEKSIPKFGILTLSKREGEYIWFVLGLVLTLIMIPSILGIFIGAAIFDSKSPFFFMFIYLLMALTYYLWGRVSLVFPSIAIDKAISYEDSWEYTKNYNIVIIITLMIFPLILSVGLNYFIDLLFSTIILTQLVSTIILIFTIGVLSVTYKYLLEQVRLEKDLPAEDIRIEESENVYSVYIDQKHEVTFDSLKNELELQYLPLGYNKNVIDKDDSWMIKNNEIEKSYILLSKDKKYYKVEVFHAQNPELSILEN